MIVHDKQTGPLTMIPSLPASSKMLVFLDQATQILQERQPLAQCMDALFVLLYSVLGSHEARLTCWLQSAQPGAQRQQFVSTGSTAYAWNDALMRQTALARQVICQQLTRDDLYPRTISHQQAAPASALFGYLGAPVHWSERLWGVLELRGANEHLTEQETCEFIEALLPQLAIAIARAGTTPQERRALPAPATAGGKLATVQPPQTQVLTRLEERLQAPLGLPELLDTLLHIALDATGAEAGLTFLVDHTSAELVLHAQVGYPPDALPTDSAGRPRQRWSWETGLAGRAAQSGRTLLVRDVTTEPDYRLTTANLRAELAAPLVADGAVLAVLVLDSPRSAAFGDTEVAFINTLCAYTVQPLRRTLAYQEIFETSNQLGQVFNSLHTGLALLDMKGRVLRSNPAWLTNWGLREQDGAGLLHVPLDLVDRLLARLADPLRLTQFCQEGQSNPGDTQTLNIYLTDPFQELNIYSVPTRDSMGQITGRLWAVSDVTQSSEVDRLKHEFVSIVSHELRTPLTSILGYTELLLERKFKPDEQRQFIETVYKQATHLNKLVEDLLSLSRIDSGKMQLHPWMVGMRQLVGELTAQLGQLDAHRLLIRFGDPLPPAYIDRDKIRQVLYNLLNNAIKYSPNGGEIVLSVEESAELPPDHPPGRWLLISVRDEGLGIAEEDLLRIWDRFYRVDNSNTRRIGGTGLGLSISRALVELHGGRIWVSSAPNQGSVFSFTIPVATEEIQREAL
jgi:signal transduction histidine kinase